MANLATACVGRIKAIKEAVEEEQEEAERERQERRAARKKAREEQRRGQGSGLLDGWSWTGAGAGSTEAESKTDIVVPVAKTAPASGPVEQIVRSSSNVRLPDDLPKTRKVVLLEDWWREDVRVVRVKHVPLPTMRSDCVLVRVKAAAVTGQDVLIATGHASFMVDRSPPLVPGQNIAGVVAFAGPDCRRLKEGDEVYGVLRRCCGGLAEYVAVPESELALRPVMVTFKEAASLPNTAMAAYQALIHRGEFQKKQRILILNASCGVGVLAVQLARTMGASRIVCTCQSEAVNLVSGLGANLVLPEDGPSWWQELKGQEMDLILDLEGGVEVWNRAADVLKPKTGRFVTLVGDDVDALHKAAVMGVSLLPSESSAPPPERKTGPPKAVDYDAGATAEDSPAFPRPLPTAQIHGGNFLKVGARIASRKFWSAFGYPIYEHLVPDLDVSVLRSVTELVDGGHLVPVVEKVYRAETSSVRQMMQSLRAGGQYKGTSVVDFTLPTQEDSS